MAIEQVAMRFSQYSYGTTGRHGKLTTDALSTIFNSCVFALLPPYFFSVLIPVCFLFFVLLRPCSSHLLLFSKRVLLCLVRHLYYIILFHPRIPVFTRPGESTSHCQGVN